MVYIMAYTGYDPPFPQGSPCASSAIDLTQVPIRTGEPPGVIICTFVLAFADDINGDGTFVPQWNVNHFTPEYIAGVMAAIPTANFAVSLGGATAVWRAPRDPQAWISNAASSIAGIMQTYGLVGVDIDYEQGPGGGPLDSSFTQCMSQLIQQAAPAYWSLAPFTQTLDAYLDLYDAIAPSYKPSINFQAYSLETEDPQAYIQQYIAINNDRRVASHGGATIGLGIDTNTTSPRGMQYPAITDFCFSYITDGPGTPNNLFSYATIWSSEDSCLNGYPVEKSLSGPPPSS